MWNIEWGTRSVIKAGNEEPWQREWASYVLTWDITARPHPSTLVFKSENGRCPMSLQSRSTFCNPMECSPPGSSFHEDSPCSPPGDLPKPGIEPASPMSPTLTGSFFVCLFLPLVPPGKSQMGEGQVNKCSPRGTVQNKWCQFPDTSKTWGRWRYARPVLTDLWLFLPKT